MQNSSSNCWAPIGDAIKLILTGATDKTLSSEQTAIYLDIFDQGMRDIEGNKSKERYLPGVQTEQYCVDEKNGKYETMYFIPDLFRFMLTMFKDWSILNPPVNLDYLNSLRDELDNPLFMFSNAPGHKRWEESEEGKEHWELICSKIEVELELVELDRTHHAGDPLKLEAQKRMRAELDIKLHDISEKLNTWTCSAKEQTSTEQGWKIEAKKLGHEYIKQYPHLNMEKISEKVHEQMKESGISGRGGRIIKASTIKRHALNNIKQ